jgi:hypothetical protein
MLYKIGRVCLLFHTIPFRLFARCSFILIIFEENTAKFFTMNFLTFCCFLFFTFLVIFYSSPRSPQMFYSILFYVKQNGVKSTTNFFLPSMPTFWRYDYTTISYLKQEDQVRQYWLPYDIGRKILFIFMTKNKHCLFVE